MLGIAAKGKDGRWWYVGNGPAISCVQATTEPFAARVFDSEADIAAWLRKVPPWVRTQLRNKELVILPLSISVGEPMGTVLVPDEVFNPTS
ncbi:MAG: hypothetical protein AB7G11_11060 [Phycisphaerales bacterium]